MELSVLRCPLSGLTRRYSDPKSPQGHRLETLCRDDRSRRRVRLASQITVGVTRRELTTKNSDVLVPDLRRQLLHDGLDLLLVLLPAYQQRIIRAHHDEVVQSL